MHKAVLRVAATEFPVTLAEIEAHLKVTDDDSYLNSLIAVATGQIERYLRRSIMQQEWTLYLDRWEYTILLPYPTLQSVESVSYYGQDGALTLLDESDFYWVVTSDEPGRIVQKYDTTYPELQDGRPDAIEIEYTAGWASADDVPSQIKHAIKLYCTDLHEHRGEIQVGQVTKIPNHILNLIHDFRIYSF